MLQLHAMEQQLAAINWQPEHAENRDTVVEELERKCQAQATTIRSLQRQLDDQQKEHVSKNFLTVHISQWYIIVIQVMLHVSQWYISVNGTHKSMLHVM